MAGHVHSKDQPAATAPTNAAPRGVDIARPDVPQPMAAAVSSLTSLRRAIIASAIFFAATVAMWIWPLALVVYLNRLVSVRGTEAAVLSLVGDFEIASSFMPLAALLFVAGLIAFWRGVGMARRAAVEFGITGMRWPFGWSVVAYCIPVINLVVPWFCLGEIDRALRNSAALGVVGSAWRKGASSMTFVLWITSVTAIYLERATSKLAITSPATSVDQYIIDFGHLAAGWAGGIAVFGAVHILYLLGCLRAGRSLISNRLTAAA